MLNRTNRTLSANSFGLNLGTRSFARMISGNYMSLQTSRLCHLHHVHSVRVVDPVRAGLGVQPIWRIGYLDPIYPIPVSSSASPRTIESLEMSARVVAVAKAHPVERTGGCTLSKSKSQAWRPAVKPQQGTQPRARARQVQAATGATRLVTLATAAAAPGAASGG
jgi:hypothetical protein